MLPVATPIRPPGLHPVGPAGWVLLLAAWGPAILTPPSCPLSRWSPSLAAFTSAWCFEDSRWIEERAGLGAPGSALGWVSAARGACLRLGAFPLFTPSLSLGSVPSSARPPPARGCRPWRVPHPSLASLWKSLAPSSAVCLLWMASGATGDEGPDAAVRLTLPCPPRETLPAHARPAVVSPDARVQGVLLATSGGRVRTQLRRPAKDWEEAPGSVLRRLASGRAVGRRAPPSSRCLGSRGETCHIVLSTCSQNRH